MVSIRHDRPAVVRVAADAARPELEAELPQTAKQIIAPVLTELAGVSPCPI